MRNYSWHPLAIIFTTFLLSFNAIASVEFASFLYFKGCQVSQNICTNAIYEIPNIEINLSNNFGEYSRIQERFGKTFNEKTEFHQDEENSFIRFNVTDETGTFIIKPTDIKVSEGLDNLKSFRFEGEKIWISEDNYIVPIYYVSKKWNSELLP